MSVNITDMRWPADKVERRSLEKLIPYARNARTHSAAQVAQIAASMTEWGWTNPVLIDESGMIIAGHGRVMAAQSLGYDEAPVMVAVGWSESQKKAYVIADNRLALDAGWDTELLAVELDELRDMEFDLSLIGFEPCELNDLIGTPNTGPPPIDEAMSTLAERFMIPPFSVLNARAGWWQDRKRAWLALGIKSELGRGENLQSLSEQNDAYRYDKEAYFARRHASPGGSARPAADYSKRQRGDGRGRPIDDG